jgi:hypothetical protein
MGRIRQMIKVHGRDSWTLFDSGARKTYVTPAVASVLTVTQLERPVRTALGGAHKESNQAVLLEAEVEGLPVSTHALVLDKIGTDEEGKSIEILFGALAMQEWGIRLNPPDEKLDMTHYPTEFVEFGLMEEGG